MEAGQGESQSEARATQRMSDFDWGEAVSVSSHPGRVSNVFI
jgi:hypothetical protein